MAVDFKTSKTKDNLMKAFAGESQARNRYTFAAEKAKKAGYEVLEKIFLFTAEQERAHAEIFYNHLKDFYTSRRSNKKILLPQFPHDRKLSPPSAR